MSRYIDADKAIAMFKEAQEKTNNIVEITSLIGSMAVIDSCKTEDVEPIIHAHWNKEEIGTSKIFVFTCSHCGTEALLDDKYCPDCGAKMDESER